MVAARHTQTVSDFREKTDETLARLDRTGEAEVLTVNGKARAVLLSPAAFNSLLREAEIMQDVSTIRQSIRESEEGKGRPAEEFFDELHAELLAMKEAKRKSRIK
jgi:PHD/YefM family antitoxin component YafN of YafNO toxin-antitoxin module